MTSKNKQGNQDLENQVTREKGNVERMKSRKKGKFVGKFH